MTVGSWIGAIIIIITNELTGQNHIEHYPTRCPSLRGIAKRACKYDLGFLLPHRNPLFISLPSYFIHESAQKQLAASGINYLVMSKLAPDHKNWREVWHEYSREVLMHRDI